MKYHFFDGAAFFRVIQGLWCNSASAPGRMFPRVWENAKITDDPVTQSNTRGMLTFATAGPNTRTTQIFINLGDNSNLDSMGFSPFGKVTSGMEVVDKLYSEYGEGHLVAMVLTRTGFKKRVKHTSKSLFPCSTA